MSIIGEPFKSLSQFIKTPSEIREYADPNSQEFLPAAAGKARALACSLYSRFPQWTVGTPLDNPVAAGLRGFWDDLCRDEPDGIPLPPTNPFAGGQCTCLLYRIVATPIIFGNPQPPGTVSRPGPISGLVRTELAGGTAVGYFYGSAACGGRQFQPIAATSTPNAGPDRVDARVDSVSPESGGADTCGNPNPPYPEPPPIPTGDDLTAFPTLPTRPGLPGIIVPVVFLRPKLEINPEITIAPEVTINVGGIDFNFNLGGLNFNFNPSFPSVPAPPSNSPPPPVAVDPKPSPPNQPPFRCDPGFTEADRQLLREIEECACETEKPLTAVVLGSGSSGTFSLPAKTVFVIVALTKNPVGLKAQFGGGGAPDVLFPGWCALGLGQNWAERIPLSYDRAVRLNPGKLFSSFSFTCTNGAEAVVTALTEGS